MHVKSVCNSVKSPTINKIVCLAPLTIIHLAARWLFLVCSLTTTGIVHNYSGVLFGIVRNYPGVLYHFHSPHSN